MEAGGRWSILQNGCEPSRTRSPGEHGGSENRRAPPQSTGEGRVAAIPPEVPQDVDATMNSIGLSMEWPEDAIVEK
jgi:hypothetical protein